MSSYHEALRLQAEAAVAVTAAGLDDVIVTLNDMEAGPALQAGVNVVLITPTQIEHEGNTAVETTAWTAHLIAGTFADPQDWWPALDSLSAALHPTFQPDKTEFNIWRTAAGYDYPARQLIFTT